MIQVERKAFATQASVFMLFCVIVAIGNGIHCPQVLSPVDSGGAAASPLGKKGESFRWGYLANITAIYE